MNKLNKMQVEMLIWEITQKENYCLKLFSVIFAAHAFRTKSRKNINTLKDRTWIFKSH